jgi:flagellar biosynthetic protein FliP
VDWQQWLSFDRLQSTAQLAISMTVLGVVPALLLMTTSYVRISVVLALLRQAFGVPNLLPLQVTTALAFFCTGWIMWPTWQLVHEKAVLPAVAGQAAVDPARLWAEGIGPVRQFMVEQIEASRNSEDVHLFLSRTMKPGEAYPASYEEVPLAALLPAFLLSELKTAFLIGFQIYLPFLVIDLVVSAVTTSMGMFLLPPATIAMPLKLLTFVLVDGWRLVVDMLLKSFQ